MGDENIPWSAIGSSLLTTVKGQIEGKASGFLADHKELETALISWTMSLGKAMFFYTLATDPGTKMAREAEIDALKDALKEESLAIMVTIEHEAKSTLMTILDTFFEVAIPVGKMALKLALP